MRTHIELGLTIKVNKEKQEFEIIVDKEKIDATSIIGIAEYFGAVIQVISESEELALEEKQNAIASMVERWHNQNARLFMIQDLETLGLAHEPSEEECSACDQTDCSHHPSNNKDE